MKLNNFYIFALALGLSTTMVSCGGGNADKKGADSLSANKEESGTAPIVGVWKITDMQYKGELPKLSPDQQKEFDKAMQSTKDSSSFEVKADGSYHTVNWAGKKYESDGTWKLSDDNKMLFLSTKNDDSTIKTDTIPLGSLSANEMVWDAKEVKVTYKK